MKSRSLTISIGSTVCVPGNLSHNLGQIETFTQQAADAGAKILVTPELSATGYGGYPEVLALAEAAGSGPIYERLATLASTHQVVVTAGFVEQGDAHRKHLAHYTVFPGGRFLVQRKHQRTAVEVPLVTPLPGEPVTGPNNALKISDLQVPIFELEGVKAAVLICMDLRIPGIHEHLAEQGVELLICPVGAGGNKADYVTTKDLILPEGRAKYLERMKGSFFPGEGLTDCIRYRRALAVVNQCGYDGHDLTHMGSGVVMSPMGEVKAFLHGLPNLDRQFPAFAAGTVNFDEKIPI